MAYDVFRRIQSFVTENSGGKIQELTTGILEIARQTNLLALMKMGEKANIAIVDSISMLSQLSEEVSAGTASSKETLNGTMEKMQGFSDIVQNTFKQLLILEETTTE